RCLVEEIDLVRAGIDVRDREAVVVADVRGKRVPDVDGERLVVEARCEGKAALLQEADRHLLHVYAVGGVDSAVAGAVESADATGHPELRRTAPAASEVHRLLIREACGAAARGGWPLPGSALGKPDRRIRGEPQDGNVDSLPVRVWTGGSDGQASGEQERGKSEQQPAFQDVPQSGAQCEHGAPDRNRGLSPV